MLDVLFGGLTADGLELSELQYFLQFLVTKTLDPGRDSDSREMLVRIRIH